MLAAASFLQTGQQQRRPPRANAVQSGVKSLQLPSGSIFAAFSGAGYIVTEYFQEQLDSRTFLCQFALATHIDSPIICEGLMSEPQARIRTLHSPEGGIVMDIDQGKLFSLNATGSVVYQLLAQGFDEQAIVDELTCRFSIAADTAKQDLHAFQNALRFHALHPEQHSSFPE
jgi:Coenzyme PQQ synthesis protein D (PqqD)